jgi:hypothetical protein
LATEVGSETWESITGIALKLLDVVHKLCERPKIHIQVEEFHHHLENDPNSSIVLVTPYPSRYYAKIVLSNVGRRLTTTREIVVLVNGKCHKSTAEPSRIEPGELRKMAVIFPADGRDAVTQGAFEIHVIDAFGKTFKSKGHFPLRPRI